LNHGSGKADDIIQAEKQTFKEGCKLISVGYHKDMKTLKSSLVLIAVLILSSCNTKKSDPEATPVAGSCSFTAPGVTEATNYGTFDPNTADQCEGFTGATSLWTGMSTSETAMVALPTTLFNGGMACGTCVSIQGASGTITGRVVEECSGCSANRIDLDAASFTAATGLSPAAGFGSVTVTPIPCPSTENIKVFTNTGTNPYYLNLIFANHVTPIKSVEVDAGGGFQAAPRVGNTGAFAVSFTSPVSSTAIVKLTDVFDQVVSATFTAAASSTTVMPVQFGTCN
jgi:hypothetical protein